MAASVMASLADPVVVIGADAELLWANPAAEERFGWPLEALVGKVLVGLVHPEDLDTALLSLASVVDKPVGSLVEVRLCDHRDEYAWFEIRGRAWADGPPGAAVLTLREITDRHRWEMAGGDVEIRQALLDHLPVVGMLLWPDGTIRGANRALTRLLHRPLEELHSRPMVALVTADDVAEVEAALDDAAMAHDTIRVEARLEASDGSLVPVSFAVVNLLDDPTVEGLLVTATEISALVEARRKLRHLVDHDDLTGLPNRTNLRRHLSRLLGRGTKADHTVLFADVDRLKAINDTHGHRAGDAVLATVAERLQAISRPGDLVARLSGDEFVVVAATTDPSALAHLKIRVDAAMHEPIALPDGRLVTLSLSVGLAPVESTVDPDELLDAADAAMYVAKRERQR
ncbi:MAG: diguanylate cyclase domain-containing protein, partial [Acidimicrobiales bacterium]